MLGPSLLVGMALPMASVIGTVIGTAGASQAGAGLASGVLSAAFQVGAALGLAGTATLFAADLRFGYLGAAAFEVLALGNAVIGFRPAMVNPSSAK
ncbi:hypothetical protein [Plantactinospora sp. KBS50]|uniref:hypothetical protein n=1 Tax=Plantactinospora sp. KBS50 TaxID=2024580 RepID=UPI000BAB1318|nr:hypothetical protein [Plantactinospora sp. KBS50]ASW55455.1 hypothetical protein CIK06_16675 [Plantactinospora sp. KBS50]